MADRDTVNRPIRVTTHFRIVEMKLVYNLNCNVINKEGRFKSDWQDLLQELGAPLYLISIATSTFLETENLSQKLFYNAIHTTQQMVAICMENI